MKYFNSERVEILFKRLKFPFVRELYEIFESVERFLDR